MMLVRINKCMPLAYNATKISKIKKNFVRYNSTQTAIKVLECLHNRSILRITGDNTTDFLQGLITNDMKHFERGAANIYSLFLNIKGRVLYDTIIYKGEETDMYYIECDSQIAEDLNKHLKMYKIRKKIDIQNLNDKIKIWTMFDPMQYNDDIEMITEENKCKLDGLIFPCGTLNNKASKFVDNINIYEDPRLPHLGFRVLAETHINKEEIAKHLDPNIVHADQSQNYKTFRYKLGVGEGTHDLPKGKALPLEINCDYLHGVSFHKGCYIGQELTARTYHTGVVRKRLMPIILDQEPTQALAYDENITDESGKSVGKFRGHQGTYGLGLMRITEALNGRNLIVSNINLKVIKPKWWPQEHQTETASAGSRK